LFINKNIFPPGGNPGITAFRKTEAQQREAPKRFLEEEVERNATNGGTKTRMGLIFLDTLDATRLCPYFCLSTWGELK